MKFESFFILCMTLGSFVSSWLIHHPQYNLASNYIKNSGISFYRTRSVLFARPRNWLKRRGEIVIDLGIDDDEHLAIEAYNKMNSAENTKIMQSKNGDEKVRFITEDTSDSFTGLTLREISRIYGFSLDYLGDFISAQGISATIDIDKKIGDMLTGHDIYELLVALQSQDPAEVNEGYMGDTVRKFARLHNIDYEEFLKLCKEHNILLPFGPTTVLHKSLYNFLLPYLDGSDIQETPEEDIMSDSKFENSFMQ